jgi:DnaJ-class molecular chaperone
MSVCGRCNGRGWVKMGDDIKECPACDGKGKS